MTDAEPPEYAINIDTLNDLRPTLRQHLLDKGMAVEAADEIIDLSFHAADQAWDALERVMFSASHPMMTMTISGIAAMIIEHRLDSMKEGILELGEKLNITRHMHTVSVKTEATAA